MDWLSAWYRELRRASLVEPRLKGIDASDLDLLEARDAIARCRAPLKKINLASGCKTLACKPAAAERSSLG